MDDQANDTSALTPAPDGADQVGLGRIIEDDRDAAARANRDDEVATDPAAVEEASAESFPASDPPGFMSDAATPRDPDRTAIEPPAPDDVP